MCIIIIIIIIVLLSFVIFCINCGTGHTLDMNYIQYKFLYKFAALSSYFLHTGLTLSLSQNFLI
jgi:hypothetical protein